MKRFVLLTVVVYAVIQLQIFSTGNTIMHSSFVTHFHMVSITSPVNSLDLNVMFVVPIFSSINLGGSLPVTSKIAWCYTE